jgi:RNA-binding protein
MLNPKQRANLKSQANRLKPVYQIGKDGLKEDLIEGLLNYLLAHELMKVSILNNSDVTEDEIKEALDSVGIEYVAKIGHIVILYKYSPSLDNHIEF